MPESSSSSARLCVSRKSRALLNYNPHTQIAEGIPKFVEWFRAVNAV